MVDAVSLLIFSARVFILVKNGGSPNIAFARDLSQIRFIPAEGTSTYV